MKLGIIGLPRSGRATVFDALTQTLSGDGHKAEDRIAAVRVPDERVAHLSQLYSPRKTIYAQVEYFLPGAAPARGEDGKESQAWVAVRNCDALIHVVRNHGGFGFEEKSPRQDFLQIDQELILSDLVVVEKRLERIELDHKRGKKMDSEEHALLAECHRCLEQEIPLRHRPELAAAPVLKGFALLSAKPMLVLFNNEDDDEQLPDMGDWTDGEDCLVIRGKLEQELAQMTPEEATDFLNEFNIAASAKDRVIQRSYEMLGLISFFTVGDDEVRAWTIPKGTPALDAAGVIHSDMKKGFIRAEVVSFDDLAAQGNFASARKLGLVRLEGKTYEVQDGDIMTFRFNV
jgi:GTP-binding protein YchF